jgi:exopolyphosphatase/guanosine-5'-triphosphate,3'-diphosphate pyrophosphatase
MRIAIIDCGTNTFNLLIIELANENNYTKIFNTRISVKLGEGAINQGFIAPLPFNRGIDALTLFGEEIRKHGVEKVLAFATSAIRDAKNGVSFIAEVNKKSKIEIRVIDGDEEADLIYLGVKEAVRLSTENSLIIDIGGGSTEFIIANKYEVLWKQSFSIGAARLLEKFAHSNPITTAEITNMYNFLNEQLSPLFMAIEKYPPVELVGSSGAFDSLVDMINGELGGEALVDTKTEYAIDLVKYDQISNLVRGSSLEQRKKIKGLVPMRFDMIVISCLMIDFVLNSCQLKKLRVSTYSLKEGALVDYINNNNK